MHIALYLLGLLCGLTACVVGMPWSTLLICAAIILIGASYGVREARHD